MRVMWNRASLRDSSSCAAFPCNAIRSSSIPRLQTSLCKRHALWDLSWRTQNIYFTYQREIHPSNEYWLYTLHILKTWLIRVFTHTHLLLKDTKVSSLYLSKCCISRLERAMLLKDFDSTPSSTNKYSVGKRKMANHTSTPLLRRRVQHIVHSRHQ